MLIKNLILKTLFLFVSGIFIIQVSFSQENYIPGYVIKLSGDTLKGLIDYRDWEENPDIIFFKEKLVDSEINFTPLEVQGFAVSNVKYESAIIETEISPTDFSNLSHDSNLKIIIDTSFLETIIQGEKSLYSHVNYIGNDQFYIKLDGKYDLLIYQKYIGLLDGKDGAVENRKYLGQLTLYLMGCPEIQIKLKDISYSKNSLRELFLLYYSCTEADIEFMREKDKIKAEFGVIAGMSFTNVEFSSDLYEYIIEASYSQSVNFSTGIFVDLILPRKQGKWSVYNELIYTSYQIDGRFDDIFNSSFYTYNFTSFEYSYLKLNNMIRFNYPFAGGNVFLNAGISNGYAVGETNYRRREITYYGTETEEEGKALNETRLYEQAYILGLGAKYNKLSFEIRKQGRNGMSAYIGLKSSVKTYDFLLAYRF